jgi:hypothetical protein
LSWNFLQMQQRRTDGAGVVAGGVQVLGLLGEQVHRGRGAARAAHRDRQLPGGLANGHRDAAAARGRQCPVGGHPRRIGVLLRRQLGREHVRAGERQVRFLPGPARGGFPCRGRGRDQAGQRLPETGVLGGAVVPARGGDLRKQPGQRHRLRLRQPEQRHVQIDRRGSGGAGADDGRRSRCHHSRQQLPTTHLVLSSDRQPPATVATLVMPGTADALSCSGAIRKNAANFRRVG